MALSVNVTISMPPEMVEKIDEQAKNHGMSRAEYVRHLAREAPSSPFDAPAQELTTNAEV
ncbi:Ribbon-helix-helix protein, copG family [Halogeometricum rufum]|uniref:Ribbon-helix-helix protein, copG family n=1 Tax=Halogeometricum rufum TaxID=553469 RepID=A0A1I6G4W5_9EURY|nr:ribbon-helix-helix domain-containing protein [Halogeometricum rufum]SFR37236.1 Ribbon-helix-helix protein, copG family [Halogeometricum rufum]